jgi:hypothetical protein
MPHDDELPMPRPIGSTVLCGSPGAPQPGARGAAETPVRRPLAGNMGSSSSLSNALLPRNVGLGDRRLDEPDGIFSSASWDEEVAAPIGREMGAKGRWTAPKAGRSELVRPTGSCSDPRRICPPIPLTDGRDSERGGKGATGDDRVEPDPIAGGAPNVFGGPIGGGRPGGPAF